MNTLIKLKIGGLEKRNTTQIYRNNRDSILFNGEKPEYIDGTAQFKINLNQVVQLVKHKFLEVDFRWGNSPTVREITELLANHALESIYVHGYVINVNEGSDKILFEGFIYEGSHISKELKQDFLAMCNSFTDFICEHNKFMCSFM